MLGMNDASTVPLARPKISWLDQHDQPGPPTPRALGQAAHRQGCRRWLPGRHSNSMEHLGRNRHYVANAIYPARSPPLLFTRDEARISRP
jgi:hypothetical protein